MLCINDSKQGEEIWLWRQKFEDSKCQQVAALRKVSVLTEASWSVLGHLSENRKPLILQWSCNLRRVSPSLNQKLVLIQYA